MARPEYQLRELTVGQRDEWDRFASAHPLGDFAQAWDWGELKADGEWRAHRLGLYQDDALVAGAQVLVRDLPWGAGRLAYASRGPLVDLTTTGAAPQRAALFDELEHWCRARGALCLKVDPCVTGEAEVYLRRCGVIPAPVDDPDFGGTQPKYVMRLDLSPGLDDVFANFKADVRNRVRKAGRRGVTVRRGESEADWRAWYALLQETATRQQFRVRAYSYFDGLRRHLTGACEAWLLLAEREARLVGGILCVRFGPTVWYLYGAMNDEGRNHYSGYVLQWDAMQRTVEAGGTVYDFRGVGPFDQPDGPHYGLNRFKSGFSPAEVEWVGEWDLVLSPLRYRLFNWAMAQRSRRGRRGR